MSAVKHPHHRHAFVLQLQQVLATQTGSGQRAGLGRRRARVQTAAATLSANSLRQTAHTHSASIHQAAKLVATLLRVARVTAGLAEVTAAYRRVYDSHLQADCQELGAPEPDARQSSTGYIYPF